MTKPYDRLPTEKESAYARFLFYRNLGPGRSIRAAYAAYLCSDKASKGSGKPKGTGGTIPGQWHRDCAAYTWKERALAWDIDNLLLYGEKIVVNHISMIEAVQSRLLAALQNEHAAPIENWQDIIHALELLSKIIPGEAAAHLYASRNKDGSNSEPRQG